MAGFGGEQFPLTQWSSILECKRGRTEALSSPRPHSPPSGRNHSDADFTFEEGGLEGTFPGPNPFRWLPGRTRQPLSPALLSATLRHPVNRL